MKPHSDDSSFDEWWSEWNKCCSGLTFNARLAASNAWYRQQHKMTDQKDDFDIRYDKLLSEKQKLEAALKVATEALSSLTLKVNYYASAGCIEAFSFTRSESETSLSDIVEKAEDALTEIQRIKNGGGE